MTRDQIELYLQTLYRKPVTLLSSMALGEEAAQNEQGVKKYGYGVPVRLDFQVEGCPRRTAVLHTMSPNPFGHEGMADRAQVLLWQNETFNRLPRHIRSLDVAAAHAAGDIVSLGEIQEFCLLTEFAEGKGYNLDLERMRQTGSASDMDGARADALCDYLVEIHKTRGPEPGLYVRRIRELVGHGECVMGLIDGYPAEASRMFGRLREIEEKCLAWRWRLKGRTHRLRQVHGDFHPWNILFRQGVDFRVLDRSRGEFGDPADDVACLTMNYVFFSLQRSGRLEGCFEELFLRFWNLYLEASQDREMLAVVAPFFAFRCLVMANPAWYPSLPETLRDQLLAFALAVLDSDQFDPEQVNLYCGA